MALYTIGKCTATEQYLKAPNFLLIIVKEVNPTYPPIVHRSHRHTQEVGTVVVYH